MLGAKTRQLSYLDALRALRFGFTEAGLDPGSDGPKPTVRAAATSVAKRPAARAARSVKRSARAQRAQ